MQNQSEAGAEVGLKSSLEDFSVFLKNHTADQVTGLSHSLVCDE